MKEKKLSPEIVRLTNLIHVIAVLCNQWGDTGKGKIIHLLSAWADIIIRGTGGANAGHTLIHNGKEFVCHQLPSGILNQLVLNIIGRGVALDLHALKGEMGKCPGLDFNNLRISHEANLVMPYHILEDLMSPKSKLIGTTGCGIGPFYADYVSRLGISINDLMNPDIFCDKLKKFMDAKQDFFDSLDKKTVQEIMSSEKYGHKFLDGIFYHNGLVFDRKAIADYYLDELGPKFRKHIFNLDEFLGGALASGKNILLEGAQGALLSIDFGTTFYQTSSDCSLEGLAKGCGLKTSDIEMVLGIAKAPYMTRVGNGPFPTEFGGRESESHCRVNTKENEAKLFIKDCDINSDDELIQGICIRKKGGEYGATTKRPRRTGWLDLVALKYATKINTTKIEPPNLVLTKLDVMTGVKKIKLCVAYKYTGPSRFYGGKIIHTGNTLTEFIRDSDILYNCQPIYQEFPGWTEDISKMKSVDELPEELLEILRFIQRFVGIKISIISVGQKSEETIFLERPILSMGQ